jgi:xanthine dehydrogenase accessory factor
VVVAVADHRGSVPRESGTRMLVAADAVVGTIGGGHLEQQAITRARALLQGRDTAAPGRLADARDAPFSPIAPDVPVASDTAGPPPLAEERIALGPSLGQCCGGAVVLRYTALANDPAAHWPPPAPRFALQLYGAGHVGRAIVNLLAAVPCRVQWLDT